MTSRHQQRASRPKQVTGIVLNAGDVRTVPALDLTVGAESQTITVSATAEMIPVENGAHVDVLSAADIDNLALDGPRHHRAAEGAARHGHDIRGP